MRKKKGQERVARMYALYNEGATLQEVGERFDLTRERVRQLFREHDLPVRSVAEAMALRRALEAQNLTRAIREAFAETHDIAKVAARCGVPRSLAREVIEEEFEPREWRKQKAAHKKYSDEELLDFLRRASAAIGGVMSGGAYDKFARAKKTKDGRPWPTKQTAMLRFGSWREALIEAGLPTNPSSPIAGQILFDQGQCVDALRAAARHFGRPPTVSEYDEFARQSNGALPSAATVRNRLGKWYEALTKAGL